MAEKYNIESFLITCDTNLGYTLYTYNNDEFLINLEPIGARVVEPAPVDEDSGVVPNYYSRQLAILGNFYQSFYINTTDGDVIGDKRRIELEGLETYVKSINENETSITYNDQTLENSSLEVINGLVYFNFPIIEEEGRIDIQLSYISCIPLVVGQNYIVEISGETINPYHGNWECKEQEGLLYLGDYNPFMEASNEEEETEIASLVELLPVENKEELYYAEIPYSIDYGEEATTRYKTHIEGNILGVIDNIQASKNVLIDNVNCSYIGNLYLFTENETDNTEENFLILTIRVEENPESSSSFITDSSRLYIRTSTAETVELTVEMDNLTEIKALEGAALMSFGRDTVDEHGSLNNYGIAINSSDDFLALPPRAISLFETTIHPDKSIKVSYNFRGILGTLPHLPVGTVKENIYNQLMAGQQGIYTDNMYIGDENQYLAFYEDEQGYKHLKISAKEMIFEYDSETGKETTWQDKIDEATQGADATVVTLTSTIGDVITDDVEQGAIYATVFTGGKEVDPLKTTVFDVKPPTTGDYYYHLDPTSKTCVLKKKVDNQWITAPSEDDPIYTYTWTFRDKNGQPWNYNGVSSVSGKAIYFNANMVDDKIVVLCDVSDNS